MLRVRWQGRVKHVIHGILRLKPLRNLQCIALMLAQARRQGAQTAQYQRNIHTPRELTCLVGGVAHGFVGGLIGSHRPHKHIRVTAQIFGHGLHHDVHAMLECFEIQRCCPSVVQDGHDVVRFGNCGNGRHVLNF